MAKEDGQRNGGSGCNGLWGLIGRLWWYTNHRARA